MASRFHLNLLKISKCNGFRTKQRRLPSSILTCVIRFPAGSYIGFASILILEVDTPGKSALETIGVALSLDSFLTGAGLAGVSPEVVLWGISRILLYFD